jgi:hypothetical protein
MDENKALADTPQTNGSLPAWLVVSMANSRSTPPKTTVIASGAYARKNKKAPSTPGVTSVLTGLPVV